MLELLRLVPLLTAHTELIAADTIRTDRATRICAEPGPPLGTRALATGDNLIDLCQV